MYHCHPLFCQKEASEYENYAPYSLLSQDGSRFCEPVTVPGLPGAFERAAVLKKIKGNTTKEISAQKAQQEYIVCTYSTDISKQLVKQWQAIIPQGSQMLLILHLAAENQLPDPLSITK